MPPPARADDQTTEPWQRTLLAQLSTPRRVDDLARDPDMESPCFDWDDGDRAWSVCFDEATSARVSVETAFATAARSEEADLAAREIDLILRLALRDADVAAWIATRPGSLHAALETRVRAGDAEGAARAKADLERAATLLRVLVELRLLRG